MSEELALVYQMGMANVFRFEHDMPVLVLQHAYAPCEWYCRGAASQGALVRVFHADVLGNVTDATWETGPGYLWAGSKQPLPEWTPAEILDHDG